MSAELSKSELGTLGETLVANWLDSQNWRLLERQWHCRWGELDLIVAQGTAGAGGQLAFVEVKTRSQGNWDAYGLMAITRSKQAKLWKTAQLYLLQHPQWAEAPCRFDVALVACQRRPGGTPTQPSQTSGRVHPAKQIPVDENHYLLLQDYIEHAFDAPYR